MGADVGVQVGHQLAGLAEEVEDPVEAGRVAPARAEQLADARSEVSVRAGIDDALGIEADGVDVPHTVVGQVDEVVHVERMLAAALSPELLAHLVE